MNELRSGSQTPFHLYLGEFSQHLYYLQIDASILVQNMRNFRNWNSMQGCILLYSGRHAIRGWHVFVGVEYFILHIIGLIITTRLFRVKYLFLKINYFPFGFFRFNTSLFQFSVSGEIIMEYGTFGRHCVFPFLEPMFLFSYLRV